MSYELRLAHDTSSEIKEYVTERIDDESSRGAAAESILDELRKLEVNPHLGSPFYGGPFESRRIYRFRIDLGGVTRDLQVIYSVNETERYVVLLGFGPVPL